MSLRPQSFQFLRNKFAALCYHFQLARLVGMPSQHLKDSVTCRESGADFLCALTDFTHTRFWLPVSHFTDNLPSCSYITVVNCEQGIIIIIIIIIIIT